MAKIVLYNFYLIILLLSCVIHAQRSSAELIFIDGTIMKGFAKLTRLGDVKFKNNRKDKPVRYSLLSDLEKVNILEQGVWNTYKYQKIKNESQGKILLEVIRGKVSLYSKVNNGYVYSPVGNPVGGGGHLMHAYSVNSSYVMREGEEALTHLGSNNFFLKNFKKAASSYFKDCASLVLKIQNEEFGSENFNEIVAFYNKECNIN